MGLWLEIVTLLIPGFNDFPDEVRRLTEFLAGISPDIPWHVTAFHGDYKMQNDVARDTCAEDLLRAVEIGRRSGLRFICSRQSAWSGRSLGRHALSAVR